MRFAFITFAMLLFVSGAPMSAHADDFAAGNAVLLDPFDPVPQIRFTDCYDDCGYHHCDAYCGYRRRCEDGCHRFGWRGGWHDGWRCDRDCGDWDHGGWRCDRDCGPRPIDYGQIWLDRMHEYDHQLDHWKDDMHAWHDAMGEWREENGHWFFRHRDYADYEWRQENGRWHYWHDNDWHDDGFDGRWHDGHH